MMQGHCLFYSAALWGNWRNISFFFLKFLSIMVKGVSSMGNPWVCPERKELTRGLKKTGNRKNYKRKSMTLPSPPQISSHHLYYYRYYFMVRTPNGEGNGNPLQYSCLEIPWTEEHGRLQSMGSLRIGHDWATSLSLFIFMHWRRKWQPTPVFLSGESQGWGSLVGCRLWGRTESDTTKVT